MTVTHTNRKGETYYLHQGTTETGKPNYFFARRDEGDLVDTVPPGYEIYESPNGQVFLRKVGHDDVHSHDRILLQDRAAW